MNDKIVLRAEFDKYPFFISFLEERFNDCALNNQMVFKLLTACEEIIVNIIRYSYKDKEKGNLEILFFCEDNLISITFIDDGIPFNPLEQAEADITKPIEEREAGGLGIFMVKQIMDEINYKYYDGKNILTIIKKIY